MVNVFRYVFDDHLYNGYSQPMPLEKGRRVFSICCPEYTDQFGDFFDVIETGEHHFSFKPKTSNMLYAFYQIIINWFSDYKLLSD
jgi:hypothetical protein